MSNHIVLDKLQSVISVAVNRQYEAIMRKRLRNHDFSIICSNCAGGVISHRLGKKFKSPTVNMWMHQRDFLKMAENLAEYMSYALEFVDSEYDYPVAKLKDVMLYFNHASTAEDAAADWERRKVRINYENLFLLMYDRENLTLSELRRIEQIPCRGKIIFSDKERQGLDYVITMKPTSRPMGAQFMDKNWLGIRSFERQFDYVDWLNQQ